MHVIYSAKSRKMKKVNAGYLNRAKITLKVPDKQVLSLRLRCNKDLQLVEGSELAGSTKVSCPCVGRPRCRSIFSIDQRGGHGKIRRSRCCWRGQPWGRNWLWVADEFEAGISRMIRKGAEQSSWLVMQTSIWSLSIKDTLHDWATVILVWFLVLLAGTSSVTSNLWVTLSNNYMPHFIDIVVNNRWAIC